MARRKSAARTGRPSKWRFRVASASALDGKKVLRWIERYAPYNYGSDDFRGPTPLHGASAHEEQPESQ